MLTTDDVIALKEKLNERKAFQRSCQIKADEAALTSQNAERRYARAGEYVKIAEKNLEEAQANMKHMCGLKRFFQ